LKDFFDYLKSAPLPVQLLGVAILAVGIVVFSYSKFSSKATDITPTTQARNQKTQTPVISTGVAAPSDYSDGTPDLQNRNNNTPSPDAKLQTAAAVWHNAHSEQDNPEWKYVEQNRGTGSFLKYRYFSKSDGCLDIQRVENGGPLVEKWVTVSTPVSPLHVNNLAGSIDPAGEPSPHSDTGKRTREIDQADLHYHLFTLPRVLAASVPVDRSDGSGAPGGQVPTGPQFCQNPHPGQFTFYWGPVSGCRQPQFRNFSDGCSHYQIFNTCAGVWEPQIYWTQCRMPPHF
jgi:hypothetical protein